MDWLKLFGAQRAQSPLSHLDRKLLKKIQPRFVPSWAQLKYLSRFLSTVEKRIIQLAIAALVVALAGWGVFAAFQYRVVVPAQGGEYTEALVGQPQFINPVFSPTNDVDADLVSLIYSGLFSYTTEGALTPDVALSYIISEDGKTYDITLRNDISWSDGEPFTADDVIFTFETIRDPEVGSPLLVAFHGVEIEKTGDYSVRFILKEPFAPFLNSLTVGIVPEHIWSSVPASGMRLAKTNLQPVGTGPWKFSKLTKDAGGNVQSYTVAKNERFYGKWPFLKSITFRFYPDYTQAVTALKSQEVMGLSFLPRDIVEKIGGRNFDLYTLQLPQYTALFFNQNQESLLKDADIRAALERALEKERIITEALGGNGTMVHSPVFIDNPDITIRSFNLDEANALLDKKWKRIEPEDYFQYHSELILKSRQSEIDLLKASSSTPEAIEAGIAAIKEEISQTVRQGMDPDQAFYRQNKDKGILRLTITTADTPEYQAVANFIARSWRSVGVQTKVLPVSSNQFVRDVLKGRNYGVLLYSEIVGADPDPYPFWHSSQTDYPGLNLSLFVDRNADKIMEDARATTDEQKRTEAHKKFQAIIAKEIPAIFLYAPHYIFAMNKEMKGVVMGKLTAPSDRFKHINEWYLKTKHRWALNK